jgi:hypothetical protein
LTPLELPALCEEKRALILFRDTWFSGVSGIIVVSCINALVMISRGVVTSVEIPSDKLERASVWAVGVALLIIFGVSSDSSVSESLLFFV